MRPYERARAIFAAFDLKDVSKLAGFMTDDVRLRLGNADTVEGKAAFVEAVTAFGGSDVHYTRFDGREVTVPSCNVFVLRQGAVAEYRSCIDATPVYG